MSETASPHRSGCASLAEILHQHALTHGDDIAFTLLRDGRREAESLTYHELSRRVRTLGAWMQESGLKGERVLLLYAQGFEFVSAFLACLHAGAIAVPCPPPSRSAHLGRVLEIIDDARPRLVLTSSSLAPRVGAWAERSPRWAELSLVVTNDRERDGSTEEAAPRAVRGDETAFLQYTSGSTSTPRGVEVTYANLLHNEETIRRAFEHSAESVIVSWLPFYHDMGLIGGILQPLYLGGRCILMTPASFLRRPLSWLEAVSRYRATTSGAPSFAYELCARRARPEELERLDLSSWRVAFNGSEPVRAATLEGFAATFSACGFRRQAFYPCYGLAEATLFVTGGTVSEPPVVERVSADALGRHQVRRARDGPGGLDLVGCGLPPPDQEVLVVDPETRRRRAADQVGEIWIRGPSVARGYWQRQDSAATFAATLADDPGAGRFLRSGDLGFFKDGQLFIAGRCKDLIILRGRNFHPQDIELVAERSHPALRSGGGAAFSVDGEWGEELVVVFEIERRRTAHAAAAAAAVRRALAEELDVAAREIVLLRTGSIPRTSSGKIRRHACRKAHLAEALSVVARFGEPVDEGGARAEAPTAAELLALAPEERAAALTTELRGELSRILRVAPERIRDTLPLGAQGLDSLGAVELQHAVESRFGVELGLRRVLADARLKELADEIVTNFGGPDPPDASPGPPPASFPLTHGQRALWFLEKLAPTRGAYNIAVALRLRGDLDSAALAAAAASMRARHAALSTRFGEVDGEPFQQVVSAVEPTVLETCSAAGEGLDRILEGLRRRAFTPFDLEQGPPLRMRLVRLGEEDHVLLVAIHHLVADFWSLTLLLQELEGLYAARRDQRALDLPPAPHFATYVERQRRWLAGPRGERARRIWESRLAGAPTVLDLPCDRPRPAVQTHTGDSVAFTAGRELADAHRRLGHRHGATLFAGLLSVFASCLHRHTGCREALVGSPTAGRTSVALKDLVGYCVNPVVVRTSFTDSPTFRELLEQVRETVLEGLEHQEYPFALLADALQGEPDPSRSPVFQVMFTLQGASGREGLGALALGESGHHLRWAGHELESLALPRRPVQLDLTLSLAETLTGELAGSLHYNADLFDATTARRFAGRFVALLESTATSPLQPIDELALLSPAQSHQVLTEWNDTWEAPTRARSIELAWVEQARRAPDVVALADGGRRLSYGELARRSARLAGRLRALGVGPEAIVGVGLERGPDLVTALLGVLEAGAAYLPLDPAAPVERLRRMLADAAPSVILTRSHRTGLFAGLAPTAATPICLEPTGHGDPPAPTAGRLQCSDSATRLAYMIHTSGSTGRPKGVMVSQAAVLNLFAGMDRVLKPSRNDPPGVWLAVTGVTFDISVLELLWTLTRGFTVVLSQGLPRLAAARPLASRLPQRHMAFSLMYFASEVDVAAERRYRLLMEGAKFADRHGFEAVWTPERHFHAFGGLFPNPSVTSAALAAVTERVRIRAGSVVLPLHHPVRVAEEWSVVDNLSGGRVGISVASGWQADDFVLAPQRFAERRSSMLRDLETLRRLWRGESVLLANGAGREVEVRILPPPVQPELPVWVTAAASPETFRVAGQAGAGVLTHLLGQGVEELAEKIELYRQAWREAGHGEEGARVSLMLHTFVDEDAARVRRVVREPFIRYLRTSFGLMRSLAPDQDLEAMTEDDLQALLERAFDRYFATSGLFGTPRHCLETIDRLKSIGVDEVACLIDFGVETDTVLHSLRALEIVKAAAAGSASATADAPSTIAEQILRYGVTHLQCTPSLARAVLSDPTAGDGLGALERLLVGGEALPPDLADELGQRLRGTLLNMYGPTETTVWSSTTTVVPGREVTLGRPVVNTRLAVAAHRLELAPPGVPGELLIGGAGVVRGYHGRPALTAERFLPDPWSTVSGSRLYRTGDRARQRGDGRIEFLGRLDHQVKLRGHRIELGEIEAHLAGHPTVREAVVVVRQDPPGDPRLVAFVTSTSGVPAGAMARGHLPEPPAQRRERLLAAHQACHLPNGITVAHLTSGQTSAIYREIFVDDVYLRHGVALRDGATVFDVGANIGLFTLYVHSRCRGARVFAFEPIPPTFAVLATNVELYGVGAELFPHGLSDRRETASFTFYPEMAGLSGRFSQADREQTRSILRRWADQQHAKRDDVGPLDEGQLDELLDGYLASETFECELHTLSQVIADQGVETIDLLKIDVERSEIRVLQGIDDEDWSRIRQLAIEVHSRELLAQARSLLEARGFQLAVAAENEADHVFMLYAVRPQDTARPSAPHLETPGLPNEARAPSAEALRRHLATQLPEAMVPSAFVVLAELPLTANQKIDRAQLARNPLPPTGDAEGRRRRSLVEPRNALEATIAEVWRRTLGVAALSIHDNFFEHGGNSLLLMQAHGRLQEALGRDVSLVELMRHPCVEALARHLQESPEDPMDGQAPAVVRRFAEGPPPLSCAQERMWFLDRLAPASPLYNLPALFRLRGRLDPAALAGALSDIVARHESLRTRFPELEGRPLQVVEAPAAVAMPRVDLSGLANERGAAESERLAGDEARRPFDLERGPLLRFVLLQLHEAESWLWANLHHIAADGWTLDLLVRDLAERYSARLSGPPPHLEPAALQYGDYAAWQRQWLAESSSPERLIAAEQQRLDGVSQNLDLPTDRARPAVSKGHGGEVRFTLPPAVVDAVDCCARDHGATLFMTLLAAYQALLGRLTHAQALTVGAPIAQRDRIETREIFGLFLNTLILRGDLRGDPSLGELVDRVRDDALAAYASQELPFEKLVEALAPGRAASPNPFFQVMFALQPATYAAPRLEGIDLSRLAVHSGTAKVDLALIFEESGGGLEGALEYRRELVDATTVRRWHRHFEILLEAALADPQTPLSRLPMLTPAQSWQATAEWNDRTGTPPAAVTVTEALARRAAQAGDAPAIVDGETRLDYRQLVARAGALAQQLRQLGVGPEVPVAIVLERSAPFVVAVVAVLEAGGIYVPLDPAYPPERLSFMLEDAGARILLTREGLLDAWQEALRGAPNGPQVVHLEGVTSTGVAVPRASRARPEQLAYVVYTSGSTGRPKGIAVSHAAIIRLVCGTDYIDLEPTDRVAHASNITFDAATFEIWGALLTGACLVIVRPETVLDPAAFGRELGAREVSVLFVTTALFNELARHAPASLGSLRYLLFGGETADPQWVGRVRETSPDVQLLHVYGPTESTTFATWHRVREVPMSARTLPIGRPVARTAAWVVDRLGCSVPPGVVGELILGGDGLARGYTGRPATTAAVFRPDDFSGGAGTRLYTTGDLARHRGDGALEFLGRIDHQIKLRGFRVELGEIEAALAAHPEVHDAAVLAQPAAAGETVLVAYVVARGARIGSQTLRRFLSERLPVFMVPALFVDLEALPMTPSGKVDRTALARAHPAATAATTARHREPATATEELVVGIWSEVLGREDIGVDHHFFELGGHSLLATRVASRVLQICGVEIPLRTIFDDPTPAALAAAVDAARKAERSAPGPIRSAPPRPAEPLSFAQERLWFLEQLDDGNPQHNIVGAVRLAGPLEATALAAGLLEIIHRHETLHSRFAAVDGRPVRQLAEPPSHPWVRIDLDSLEAGRAESAWREVARREVARRSDLARDSLLRVMLVHLGDEHHILVLKVHHMVADGWSLRIFLDELATLYQAFARGLPSPLEALPIRYADYAIWQRQQAQRELFEAQAQYWRERLAGGAVLELPTDRPRRGIGRRPGGTLPVVCGAKVGHGLARTGRRHGATLFMTLLAAFQTLLQRHTQQADPAVGTPVANRRRSELEGLIGFFVNMLVMRLPLDPRERFGDLLERVRDMTLEAYDHQDLPFEKLVEELEPERSLHHTPLFQVVFALQESGSGSWRLPGLVTEPIVLDSAAAKFDLSLSLEPAEDGLRGHLEFDRDLFDLTTMQRLVGHFEALLTAAAASPEQRLDEMPMLSRAEVHQLAEWSGRPGVVPVPRAEGLVGERVVAQARHRPEAVAVQQGERCLSYGCLAERAAELARRLTARGAGPEVPVVLAIERSPEFVVGAVGIALAGAAYVPLDPSYPADRLSFVATDCGAPLAVTRAELAPRLAISTGATLHIDAPSDPDSSPPAAPGSPIWPQAANLAYTIYTSGSVGRPKGVAVSHGALLNLVRWHLERFTPGGDDRATQLASPAFDASVWEIWPYLTVGASLHIPDEDTRTDPLALRDWLVTRRITQTFLPTPLAEHAVDLAWPPRTALGTLLTGGDRLHVHPRTDLPFELVNNYGPTENAVVATSGRVEPGGAMAPGIGRPIAGVEVHLLDPRVRPLPLGVPGEIHLGGLSLARGYAGRPRLTAASFIPQPAPASTGERLYRTGDLARHLHDGTIDFLGRRDHQVQIRGFRVEPGEIEATLVTFPGVREAAVRAHGEGDRERLCGYLVAAGPPPDVDAVRDHLVSRLPPYMVPSEWVVLEALPLDPHGKVDRQRLAEPSSSVEAMVAPRTALEVSLAEIWQELLGRERVGLNDDFFALGGHSLLAVRVLSRIRERHGVSLPLRAVFEAPRLGELARCLSGATDAHRAEVRPLLAAAPNEELVASFAQERLFFLDQLDPGQPAYNIPIAFHLRGAFVPTTFHRALTRTVERHEGLRTTFEATAAGPRPRIHAPMAPPLPLVDLSALRPARREPQSAAVLRRAARQPFHLDKGPLLRALLVRCDATTYVGMINVHHIVADGWSMGIFLGDMAAFYRAEAGGQPATLPTLPVRFSDYARWQREELSGEVLEPLLDYWRRQLAGGSPVLDLPTDRPRPATASLRGASIGFQWPAGLAERLTSRGRELQVTLFMVLTAAFEGLLYRYTGQRSLRVGTVVAHRRPREAEPVVGLFVNTLVLRTDLERSSSFRGLLEHAHDVTLEAFAHQDLPFEMLVEELAPERHLDHSPLFQVMVVLQNAPRPNLELAPGLMLEPTAVDTGTAKFDLVLGMEATEDRFGGALELSTDLFDSTTGRRWVGHYRQLLGDLVRGSWERPLTELGIFSPWERHQLLASWNDTRSATEEAAVGVHRSFEAQARSHSESLALVGGDRCWTYGALDTQAEGLARRLRRLGVDAESRVGLATGNDPTLALGALAILKAGGAYVALDLEMPPQRLARTLADARATLVLTLERWRERLPTNDLEVLAIDHGTRWIDDRGAAARPGYEMNPLGLAYVIYTSGSTGEPNGVELTHGGLANLVSWHRRRYGLGPGDRLPQIAGTGFDASVWEVWAALTSGATLHFPDDDSLRHTPVELGQWLARAKVTSGFLPTPLAEALLDSGLGGRALHLRTLLTGGDTLRRRPSADAPFELHNHYGPTESTVVATVGAVGAQGGRPSIGRPIDHLEAHVLGKDLQLLPVGAAGELHIAGAGLARGYLGHPRRSAVRFLPHPLTSRPGDRLFKTGDRVRWLPQGELDFLGRVDHQIKLRGFRIELGEIETVLSRHPDVREALVAAPEVAGEPRLTSWIVAQAPYPEPDALRRALRRILPEYMVPAAFVFLDTFPLTVNGKIDRQALPTPDGRQLEPTSRRTAPRTSMEAMMVEIFAEVLDTDLVGVEESFFDLGGHSLLATRVKLAVRDHFGVELPMRTLFEASTPAALARRVEAALADTTSTARTPPPITRGPRNGALPLSFSQDRLWFLDRFEPASAIYNIPAMLRLRGPLSVEALTVSLGEILRRHEVLRTTFRLEAGRPAQVIAPGVSWFLPLVDLVALDAGGRSPELERLGEAVAKQPFDLERGPVFRVLLIRLARDEHALLLVLHHIAGDGASVEIFMEELTALYSARRSGAAATLPELPVQYADYARWQRRWLSGEVLEQRLAFWRDQLAEAPARTGLNADHEPSVRSSRGGRLDFLLPPALTAKLRALSRRRRVTLFMTLLAAFKALLHRHTGASDLTVGSPVANRQLSEISRLVGFFVNTLVLRTDLSGNPKLTELLERIRTTTLEAYAHEDLPFEKLVAEIRPHRDLDATPLFQVMFAFQNRGLQPVLPGLELEITELRTETARFDLTLALAQGTNGVAGTFTWRRNLFETTTLRRLAGHLEILLEGIAMEGELRLSELPILSPGERQQLVREWSSGTDGRLSETEDFGLWDLFSGWAERAPHRPAALCGECVLTYGELRRRAEELAGILSSLGIGPEDRVGICLDRSLEMVIAIWGVLRSGAVYVPLASEQPRERLSLLAREADLAAVVCDLASEQLLRELAGADSGPPRIPITADAAPGAAAPGVSTSGVPAEAGPAPRRHLDNAVYMMYTSGSTGRPKGVVVEERQLLHYCRTVLALLRPPPGCRFAMVQPLEVDSSLTVVFPSLLSGGALHLIPRRQALEAPSLAEEFIPRPADYLKIAPSHLRALEAALERRGQAERIGAILPRRALVFGGESPRWNWARDLQSRKPGLEVQNHYGPTETTVAVTMMRIGGHPPRNEVGATPLGRSLGDSRLYAVSPQATLVPLGATGELWVGGPLVSRGYHARAHLTAVSFVPDPYSGLAAERLYRTGDRVRHHADGNLAFLGRVDHQVKIRGFRIELGEIESTLLRHSAVREAVVVLRGERLVAYVTAAGETPPEPPNLRRFLSEKLTAAMVPAAVVLLDEMPRRPQGKLDRRALAKVEPERPVDGPAPAVPRTPIEEKLVEIWKREMDLPEVGIHDDFFALGGHSLLAVQLLAAVQESFGCEVSLRELFENTTIAALAEVVEKASKVDPDPAPILTPRSRERFRATLSTVGGGGMWKEKVKEE